jgi:hypothetical protein
MCKFQTSATPSGSYFSDQQTRKITFTELAERLVLDEQENLLHLCRSMTLSSIRRLRPILERSWICGRAKKMKVPLRKSNSIYVFLVMALKERVDEAKRIAVQEIKEEEGKRKSKKKRQFDEEQSIKDRIGKVKHKKRRK